MKLGDATIDRAFEQSFPVSVLSLTTDEALIERRAGTLPPGFLDRKSNAFAFTSQSWIVQVDGLVVLVDPCTGNGRHLGQAPVFDDLDTPYLDRLGVRPERVDVVFSTHLHHDHCGWNVRRDGGRWVPTFPNASYLFVDAEYERWASTDHPNTFSPNVFGQCVRPVVDAGLATVVSPPHRVSPSLTIEPAPGHTLGHAVLRLESDGTTAYFTGDAFHHPLQFTDPGLHLPGCDDLARAIETRAALVDRVRRESAFVFPAHFPAPHYGRLGLDGDEVCFLPGETGLLQSR
ncbi:MBL fold metallo-hydrolase [Cryptosporangium sp. NPDC048952]|uniref:MBL fold metallo-hydrolase n=1 Tax=Cryptosporangium sp. NPDC048952 TaxID=3363961 RepID=UPI003724AE22